MSVNHGNQEIGGSSGDQYDGPKASSDQVDSLSSGRNHDEEGSIQVKPDGISSSTGEGEATSLFLKVLAAFAAIGGFLFGYDTGVVSGALILLKNNFDLPTIWQELFVTITIAAAAVSASLGGVLNDRFGRRPVIQVSSVVFLIGALVLSLSYNIPMLIIGRGIVGIGVGLASMTIPMYIAELSPPHVRGRFVTVYNLFITAGQFVAALIDGMFSYWSWGWRCMLGLAGVPALIQLIGFLFLPESPRWLIQQGRPEEAKQVLLRTRGPARYQAEYEELMALRDREDRNQNKDGGYCSTISRMVRTPTVRRALILGCGLQMFQQLAGINTIMYYSASILRMSGVRSDKMVIWLAAAVAFFNFSFSLVGVYFIERLGRRKLGLGSMAGVALSQVFLTGAFYAISTTSPDVTSIYNGTASASCSSFHTCDGCVIQGSCGFCYDTYENDSVANSYCLAVNDHLVNESKTGQCSRSNLPQNDYIWADDYCPSPLSFLALIGLVLYLIAFAPGMSPLPWTINAEIYPLWARSTGNAIASTVNWTCNIIVSMTFLSLTEIITRQDVHTSDHIMLDHSKPDDVDSLGRLGDMIDYSGACTFAIIAMARNAWGTFALYAVICFIGLLFIYLCLPETKGKPLEQVTALFRVPLFSVGRATIETEGYEVLGQEEVGCLSSQL